MALGAWLPGHIDEMLALPGFIEANRFDPVTDDDGRSIHTVQYILSDQAALDDYLLNHAEQMRAVGEELFGDALEASRNVHAVVNKSEQPDARCLNCDVSLDGQYCWNCGQRGNTRLISLMELVRDAVGDMFELDSRMWRTLLPLLRRPGYLTAEYLRGRRARFMPPFRMYLVLSFVFFLLMRAIGDGSPTINFNGDVALSEEERTEMNEALDEATRRGDLSPEIRERVEATVAALEAGESAGEQQPRATGDSVEGPAQSDSDAGTDGEEAAATDDREDEDDRFYCQIGVSDTGIPWIDERITPERVQAVCDDIKSDSGRRFLEKVAQNTPVAALALLPLLALLLKMMYPLSRRYYVEHLLLLVHYHSFAFLAVSLAYLYNVSLGLTAAPDWLFIIPNVLVGMYIPFYLYKAMRRVYEQGRFITIIKYLFLIAGYLAAVVLVLVLMLLFILLTY